MSIDEKPIDYRGAYEAFKLCQPSFFPDGVYEAVCTALLMAPSKPIATQPSESSFRAALKELVDLKHIKDTDGETPDYRNRRPAAWAHARQLLRRKHLACADQPVELSLRKGFTREKALDFLRAHNDGVYKITASKHLDELVEWLLDHLQPKPNSQPFCPDCEYGYDLNGGICETCDGHCRTTAPVREIVAMDFGRIAELYECEMHRYKGGLSYHASTAAAMVSAMQAAITKERTEIEGDQS